MHCVSPVPCSMNRKTICACVTLHDIKSHSIPSLNVPAKLKCLSYNHIEQFAKCIALANLSGHNYGVVLWLNVATKNRMLQLVNNDLLDIIYSDVTQRL